MILHFKNSLINIDLFSLEETTLDFSGFTGVFMKVYFFKGQMLFTILLSLSSCQEGVEQESKTSFYNIDKKPNIEKVIKSSRLIQEAIPFDYVDDGCFARTYLTNAVLANNGIKTYNLYMISGGEYSRPNAHFLIPGTDPFADPFGTFYWHYHVAPYDKSKKGVYDFAFTDKAEAENTDIESWLSEFTHSGTKVCKTYLTQGSIYANAREGFKMRGCSHKTNSYSNLLNEGTDFVVNSAEVPVSESYHPTKHIQFKYDEREIFEYNSAREQYEKHPFYMTDIATACHKMYKYLGHVNDKESRREILVDEVQKLIKSLSKKGFLSLGVPPNSIYNPVYERSIEKEYFQLVEDTKGYQKAKELCKNIDLSKKVERSRCFYLAQHSFLKVKTAKCGKYTLFEAEAP